MVWKTPITTSRKNYWSPNAVQEECIQPRRPDWSRGTAVARVLCRPGPPTRDSRACCPPPAAPEARDSGDAEDRKFCTAIKTLAGGGADQRDRRSQLARQRQHVDVAALLAQLVGHVQQHQRRQAQRNHACGQHQVACAGWWSSEPE